jgi:hypothetical protein
MPRSRRVATPRSPGGSPGIDTAAACARPSPARTSSPSARGSTSSTSRSRRRPRTCRGLWPELEGVVFEVAQGPAEAIHGDHVDRWKVAHDERRITFYRLPIVRFLRLQEGEDRDEKLLIESCVFRAVAELLDKDRGSSRLGAYRHL